MPPHPGSIFLRHPQEPRFYRFYTAHNLSFAQTSYPARIGEFGASRRGFQKNDHGLQPYLHNFWPKNGEKTLKVLPKISKGVSYGWLSRGSSREAHIIFIIGYVSLVYVPLRAAPGDLLFESRPLVPLPSPPPLY